MAFFFIPSLVALLIAKEKEIGRELTQDEVESIRDNAIAIVIPEDVAMDMHESRGYQDLDADDVWNEWCKFKNTRDSD